MSYILDALQKSEHERRQKQHSVQINPFEEQEFSPSKSRSLLPWLLVGSLLLLLTALAIVLWFQWPTNGVSKPVMDEGKPAVATVTNNKSVVADEPTVQAQGKATNVKTTNFDERANHLSSVSPSQAKTASSHSGQSSVAAPAVKLAPASSEVKRLYAQSEQRRELEKKNFGGASVLDGASTQNGASIQNGKASYRSDTSSVGTKVDDAGAEQPETPELDTDAIVVAALTQLQNGVAPPQQAPVDNDPAPVQLAPSHATRVDLTDASATNTNNPTAFPTADALPENVRSALPSLKYTSHIYSSSSQKGFVMINGGKYREGESVAPGVYIEKIQDEGVVLSFGGHLFFQEAMTDWEKR